jgi:cytochrome c oxidase cbb3-type subunit 1
MTANEPIQKNPVTQEIDASCRVPLLVLFGGAAAWLVVSSLLALVASLTFHMPEKFGDCSWLTYGHVQPAADDALLYGFCILLTWCRALIFARFGQSPCAAQGQVVAAHLWYWVLVGLVGILRDELVSPGWNPAAARRCCSSRIFSGPVGADEFLGAVKAAFPSHWFGSRRCSVSWIYSTANILIVGWPGAGVVQVSSPGGFK